VLGKTLPFAPRAGGELLGQGDNGVELAVEGGLPDGGATISGADGCRGCGLGDGGGRAGQGGEAEDGCCGQGPQG
jgi:hypothetical protein